MDEKEFLAGLNRKEERAWKELYDYFYSPLCVYSSRIAGDGTAAEDIVQDCLVKLWHSTVCFEEMKVLTSYFASFSGITVGGVITLLIVIASLAVFAYGIMIKRKIKTDMLRDEYLLSSSLQGGNET